MWNGLASLVSRGAVTRASCSSAPIPIGPAPAPYANNPRAISASRSRAKNSPRNRSPTFTHQGRGHCRPDRNLVHYRQLSRGSKYDPIVGIGAWRRRRNASHGRHIGQRSSGETRISCGPELGTFCLFHPLPASIDQGRTRDLQGCAGLRPRRIPPAVGCGCPRVSPCTARRSVNSRQRRRRRAIGAWRADSSV